MNIIGFILLFFAIRRILERSEMVAWSPICVQKCFPAGFGYKQLSLDCAVAFLLCPSKSCVKWIGMLQPLSSGHSLLLKLPNTNLSSPETKTTSSNLPWLDVSLNCPFQPVPTRKFELFVAFCTCHSRPKNEETLPVPWTFLSGLYSGIED